MKYWKSITLLVLFFLLSPLYSKFHPEIKWEKISSDKFIVIYPGGFGSEAVETLNKVDLFYNDLKKFWKSDIRGKVRILLTDNTDLPVEESGFFPYNNIRISLYPPAPDSLFGNNLNWINSALIRGLNRIFIYSQGSKFLFFMRKYTGNNPILLPTLIIPAWIIEGLGSIPEVGTGENRRFHTPEFRIYAETILAGGKLPVMGSLKSEYSKWPGPDAKYIFGALFGKKLSEYYSRDQIVGFVKNFSRYPLPLLIKDLCNISFLPVQERFAMEFGDKMKEFWLEAGIRYMERTPKKYPDIKKLTTSGFYNKYPVAVSENEVAFFRNDLKKTPGVFLLNKDSGKVRMLFKKFHINGMFWFKKEKKLYFSAVDYHKAFFRYSDIYFYDFFSGRIERVTRGKRLSSPVRIRDRIYFVKREKGSSFLGYFEVNSGKTTLLTHGFASISKIAVSPDEKYIAASVKKSGSNWEIGLFSIKGNLIRFLDVKGRKSCYPRWKNKSELFFISEFNGNYRLSGYNMDNRALEVYDSPKIPPVKYFDFCFDESIIISFIDRNGFNLGVFNPSDLSTVKVEEEDKSEKTCDKPELKISGEANKYGTLKDLLPQYFSLSIRLGGDEIQPGFIISGFDVLKKHYFTFKTFTGLKNNKLNYSFTYRYNGGYGTIGLEYSKFYNFRSHWDKGKFINTSERGTLSYGIPLFKNNVGILEFYSDIHFEAGSDYFPEAGEKDTVKNNGLRTGVYFRSAKSYYDSHSLSDGVDLYVLFIKDLKFLGSSSDINTAIIGLKQYISLFRPNTLAVRFLVADSWGEGRRRFYLGGSASKEKTDLTDNNPFSLLRGYPEGYFEGTGGFSLNVEYRMLLGKIERPLMFSRSIERLFFSIFADSGQVWGEIKRIDPVLSVGGELNLVFYVGKEKFVLALGAGVGIHPEHSPRFYLRIGNSF